MKLTLEHDGDDFCVWAMLDEGDTSDPRHRSESFVIGTGATKEDAVTSAIRDLEHAMEQADHLR